MKSFYLKTTVTAALVGAIALAFGAPGGIPGPGGGGGGGGGGPPEDHGNRPDSEAGFSLSLPAVFAGGQGQFEALVCGTESFSLIKPPDKDPVFYPNDCAMTHDGEVCVGPGNYFVQRDAAWQAPCWVVATANADAKWGDNLAGGDAMLKVGSPIRVELLLFDSVLSAGQMGYNVVKLQPNELDRMSDYGHLAEGDPGSWTPIEYEVGKLYEGGNATIGEFNGTFKGIVFDPTARIRIDRMEGENVVATIVDEPAGGEINATGKIVYGYNLRVAENGTYRITYTTPNVTMTCLDAKADCSMGNATFLEIVVPSDGGGGEGEDVAVSSSTGGNSGR